MTALEKVELRPTIQDTYPLALDGLASVDQNLIIKDADADRETLVGQLTHFYHDGLTKAAQRKNIFTDLPDRRLWPEEYVEAYEWLLQAEAALIQVPELIFKELITNADMHGGGFAGIAAAWKYPATFLLRIADRGNGFGASDRHGDGIAWQIFILDFITEAPRDDVSPHGHVLGLCRNLDQIALPEQKGAWGDDIAKPLRGLQSRRLLGKPLPQLNPNSRLSYGFDPTVKPYGATLTYNLLGEIIKTEPFTEEPDGFI